MDYIYSDNVRILYLSYNGEKLREKTAKLSADQKKNASLIVFNGVL
jgi:hypothetical protein